MEQPIDAVREVRLRDVGIFQDLTLDEIRELEKNYHFKEVAAKTVFYESREAGETVFFIKEGRVRLYHLRRKAKPIRRRFWKPVLFSAR